MSFKIYFNKKTKHPSISLSGKDKKKWENMEMTHHPTKKHAYIKLLPFLQMESHNLMLENTLEKIIREQKASSIRTQKYWKNQKQKLVITLKRIKKDDGKLHTA